MHLARSLAVLASLALPLAAQSVHVVDKAGGPGSAFVEIQNAVQAASEGDTILIRSGTYAPVNIVGKSLELVADAGAFVDLLESPLTSSALLRVSDLTAGQSVVVRGFRLRMSAWSSEPTAIALENNAGSVWIEDTETAPTFLHAIALRSGLIATDCAGVTLTRCSILASVLGSSQNGLSEAPPGIAGVDSNLTLFDTLVVGANGENAGNFNLAQNGGHGVAMSGGLLYASGSTLRGGKGGSPRSGQNGADGGDGILLENGGPIALLLETSAEGGLGSNGNGPGTTPGSDGDPSTVLSGSSTTLAGTARSFETVSPIRAGATMTETFHGEPGDVVVLAYSLVGPLPGVYLPFGKASLVITPPVVSIVKGVIGPAGDLVTQPVSTPLGLGQDVLPVALQGAMLSASGGGVYFTSPSFLTLLDPSF